ncbi:hypothetical protein GCM10023322_43930 [Rugosimonospora acidiphila]|uniref:Uncharacterized protein n=1 Tax=Rugosimonospora acidiphila TaxID=556531 RepID=A0ABP9S373_9ACTN
MPSRPESGTGWPVLTASVPLGAPPTWAVLERRLFDVLDEAWRAFRDRYTEPDGRLRFTGTAASRDGADDFYETFFNWPTLYLLGGHDDLLPATKLHWEGVTRQLSGLGYLVDEFERGYDWFHQGESMLLFYGICAADPADERFRERAERFARLYLPDSPSGNYDPITNTIRAPHNGAGGPRYGVNEEWASYPASLSNMRPYGLPLDDLPGIGTWSDLEDPGNAAAMGAAMNRRLGHGDTAINLAATGLATNAWLYGHDERYRDWALRYVDGWRERAAKLGGVLPDNVGPHGEVGELHDGHWYGGTYGWAWPHGIYSVGTAAVVAAVNTVLLTGATDRLDLGREALDLVLDKGIDGTVTATEMTNKPRWLASLGEGADRPTLLVPNRHGSAGWFDYQPPQLGLSAWLWQISGQECDARRLADIHRRSGYDWRTVREFRDKEEAGHEAPWLAYLRGDNPTFPEQMLRQALAQVGRRMALIEVDDADPAGVHFHHWQWHNPVVTEALLQLATGTPQVLYNGGLLPTRLAYFDADRRRPGLPPDVAALVDGAAAVDDAAAVDGAAPVGGGEPERIGVRLVNLSPTRTRRVVVQAGSMGGDTIDAVSLDVTADGRYPGDMREYAAGPLSGWRQRVAVNGPRVEVVLPPARQVRLELECRRRTGLPRYATPWT